MFGSGYGDVVTMTGQGATHGIVVGIPSYRRPEGLIELLESLEKQSSPVPLYVIVAENDLVHQGAMRLVAEVAPRFRFPLSCVLSEQRGISAARNALVQAFLDGDGYALAMLDDDQWIEPNWFDRMVTTQTKTGADVVGSTVVPDFRGSGSAMIQGHPIFWRPAQETGLVDFVSGAGGVLVQRRVFREFAPTWFDHSLSFSGGEDKDFFMRAKRAGAVFANCAEAITHEVIPLQRQNIAWIRQRCLWIGAADLQLEFRYATGTMQKVLSVGKIGAGFLRSAIMTAALLWHPNAYEYQYAGVMRARGKLMALFGRRIEPYL